MKSIRDHLITGLFVGLVPLWVAASGAAYFLIRHSLQSRFDARLQVTISEALTFLPSFGPGAHQQSSDMAWQLENPESGFFIMAKPGDRDYWERSPSLRRTSLPPPEAFSETPQFYDIFLGSGGSLRVCAVERVMEISRGEEKLLLPVHIMVAQERGNLDEQFRVVLGGISVVGLLTTLVCMGLIRRAVRGGLTPLNELGTRLNELDAQALTTRFEADDVPEEIHPLLDHLNNLLQRLENSFERERRFSADLAHELKTPVAELRNMAEVALRWPETITADAYADVLRIATQLQRLTETLLSMARMEQIQDPGKMESVAMDQVARYSWKELEERARAKNLQVTIDMPQQLRVSAQPAMLQIIVNNLLVNAVSHCPKDGQIRVVGRRISGSDRVTLQVSNTNAGLEEDSVEHLFERFWRHSGARSEGDHLGLGLSLAKECADAMGMLLVAHLTQGGAMVTFQLTAGVPHLTGAGTSDGSG